MVFEFPLYIAAIPLLISALMIVGGIWSGLKLTWLLGIPLAVGGLWFGIVVGP